MVDTVNSSMVDVVNEKFGTTFDNFTKLQSELDTYVELTRTSQLKQDQAIMQLQTGAQALQTKQVWGDTEMTQLRNMIEKLESDHQQLKKLQEE